MLALKEIFKELNCHSHFWWQRDLIAFNTGHDFSGPLVRCACSGYGSLHLQLQLRIKTVLSFALNEYGKSRLSMALWI